MNERARLNNLLSNLQTMQNERERQENESRRRALKETERLEGEVQSLKSKLNEESEETRRLASLRELESRELQERIDKANVELASAREQLVAATTARDQLQARVEEQAILLKSSEEKLAVFSKPGTSTNDVNREQQLEVEIAELKKALELTKTELRDAKEYAEKMKDISATAEEVLQDMNTAHDKFKETMDQQLADNEVTPSNTTQLSDRLSSANSRTNLRSSVMNFKRATRNSRKSKASRKKSAMPQNKRTNLSKQKLPDSRKSRKRLNCPKASIKKTYAPKLISPKKLNSTTNANSSNTPKPLKPCNNSAKKLEIFERKCVSSVLEPRPPPQPYNPPKQVGKPKR